MRETESLVHANCLVFKQGYKASGRLKQLGSRRTSPVVPPLSRYGSTEVATPASSVSFTMVERPARQMLWRYIMPVLIAGEITIRTGYLISGTYDAASARGWFGRIRGDALAIVDAAGFPATIADWRVETWGTDLVAIFY